MAPISPGEIRLDVSMWPIAVFHYPAAATDAGWLSIFDAYSELYKRRERFYVINDGTHIKEAPGAATRSSIARLSREHEPEARRWLIGSAVVVANPLLRGALTAITWLAPPVYKLTYHGATLDALDEIMKTFERLGLTVPEAARRRRAQLALAK